MVFFREYRYKKPEIEIPGNFGPADLCGPPSRGVTNFKICRALLDDDDLAPSPEFRRISMAPPRSSRFRRSLDWKWSRSPKIAQCSLQQSERDRGGRIRAERGSLPPPTFETVLFQNPKGLHVPHQSLSSVISPAAPNCRLEMPHACISSRNLKSYVDF